jgi:hypothetical protein
MENLAAMAGTDWVFVVSVATLALSIVTIGIIAFVL